MAAAQATEKHDQDHAPESDQAEPPSTPPEQVEKPLVKASPAHQRDLHQQRRRRRASDMSVKPFEGLDRNEASPTSTQNSSSPGGDSSPLHVEDSIYSSSDEDGDIAMNLDDATGQTVRSEVSSSSTGSSLDDRLRRAAAEAGTRGIEYDENSDDLSMELADGTITNAFQSWVDVHQHITGQDASAQNNRGDVNPFLSALPSHGDANSDQIHAPAVEAEQEEETLGVKMDMTVAAGSILTANPSPRKQISFRGFDDGDQSEEADTEDIPMNMTIAAGGILSRKSSPGKGSSQQGSSTAVDIEVNEGELTQDVGMDMTVAAGSILPRRPSPNKGISFQDIVDGDDSQAKEEDKTQDSGMDMTVAAGGILTETQPRTRKISLQEFLDMTNIHFMELSTTKRRRTMSAAPPRPSPEGLSASHGACFAAAATTVPLLELYQHATRELKSYISTGRKIIGTIEQETMEDQPALFLEYADARPDMKVMMDNQFRNGKANARLQSKEGWYAWRRQLVDGLRGGLDGIKADMEQDAHSLTRQEAILGSTVSHLVTRLGQLEQEARTLQQRAEDFETVDHASLRSARAQLASADKEVAEKSELLKKVDQHMTDKLDALAVAQELKTEFQSQIAEAERVLDECRGWKSEDVRAVRDRVESIEMKTGWSLVTAEHEIEEGDADFGPALTMRFRSALRLFFHPTAFKPSTPGHQGRLGSSRSKSESGQSAPISLTYAPADGEDTGSANLTTVERFFLQLLQGQLHALAVLPRGSISPRTLLTLVEEGWDLVAKISEEIRRVEIAGITRVSILSDDKLGVNCMLILPSRSRVDVHFTLTATPTNEGRVPFQITVEAMAKYGSIATLLNGGKATKVREALNKQAGSKPIGEGGWAAAIRGLENWATSPKTESKQGYQSTIAGKPTHDSTTVTTASVLVSTTSPVEKSTLTTEAAAGAVLPKKELKKPAPMVEIMEEAAARQEEARRQEKEQEEVEMPISATKTPVARGRRPGALRRTP
ncbi:hypothetical protein HC762_00390 [bacterium]|nr:hypothetical protein [bacterium]